MRQGVQRPRQGMRPRARICGRVHGRNGATVKIETLSDFLVLVKCRGFSRAARQLYVSQPSLSSRIATMEKELGFQVVDRSHSDFALTKAGTVFLGYAQTIVDTYEKGRAEGRACARELPPLRVAGISTDSEEFALVAEIRDPAFEFVGGSVNTPFLETVTSGQADIELTSIPVDENLTRQYDPNHAYAIVPAGFGRGAIAMAASNPLALKDDLTLDDLYGATVLIENYVHFDTWRRVVEEMIGSEAHLQYQLRHADTIAELSRMNLGDALHVCALESMASFYGRRDDIVVRATVDGHELRYPIYLVYRRDSADPRIPELAEKMRACLLSRDESGPAEEAGR